MTNSPGTWPCLTYADAPAALRFLVDVLGFHERAVHAGDDGREIAHAELRCRRAAASCSEARGCRGRTCRTAPVWSTCRPPTPMPCTHALVGAGADIAQPPTEQSYGSRECAVRDPEGVVWSFGTYGGE